MKPLQSSKIVWMGLWSGGLVGRVWRHGQQWQLPGDAARMATTPNATNQQLQQITASCFSAGWRATAPVGRVLCVTVWTLSFRIPGLGEAVQSAGRCVRQIWCWWTLGCRATWSIESMRRSQILSTSFDSEFWMKSTRLRWRHSTRRCLTSLGDRECAWRTKMATLSDQWWHLVA